MSDVGQTNIQLLLQRLKVATLPAEKNKIVSNLKELAQNPKFKKAIGRVALPQLVETLCRESSQEVVTELIELLSQLVTAAPTAGDSDGLGDNVYSQRNTAHSVDAKMEISDPSPLINTEFLLQDYVAVDKLLSLLKEKDKIWLRLNAVQLLGTLANNRPEMMGKTIAAIDAGIMRLVDVLDDQREEVRNELLLLLISLTSCNEDIQNFCAFNEVYDRLFVIMEDEDMIGPIVQDCLHIIGNTLVNNQLTCKIFASSRCCKEVIGFLKTERLLQDVPSEDLRNLPILERSLFKHALNIVSNLVSAANTPLPESGVGSGTEAEIDYQRTWMAVRSCQDQLGSTPLIKQLSTLCFGHQTRTMESSIRILCLKLLGNLIRRNKRNQRIFNDAMVSARLGTADIPAPALLLSIILQPGSKTDQFNSTVFTNKTPRNNRSSSPYASRIPAGGDFSKDSQKMIRITSPLDAPLYIAAVYVFNAFLEENDDHLIQVLGEAMMSPAHLLAMAEASGNETNGATERIVETNNIVRLIVDAIGRSGKSLLESCGADTSGSVHATNASIGPMSSAVTSLAAADVHEFWKACRLLESLLRCSKTVKELALRLPIGNSGQFLLGYMLQFLSKLTAVGTGLALPVIQVSTLRLVCEWTSDMPRVVTEIWQSTSNVFLLDLAARKARQLDASELPSFFRNDQSISRVYSELGTHIRGLASLYVGICMQCQCQGKSNSSVNMSNKNAISGNGGHRAAVVPSAAINLLDFVKGPRLGLDEYFTSLDAIRNSAAFAHTRSKSFGGRAEAFGSEVVSMSPGRTIKDTRVDDYTINNELVAVVSNAQISLLTRLYDRRFVRFFRSTADSINATVVAIYTGMQSLGSDTSQNNNVALGEEAIETLARQAGHLKKLVRSQEKKLTILRNKEERLETLETRYDSLRYRISELTSASCQAQFRESNFSQDDQKRLEEIALNLKSEDREVSSLKSEVASLNGRLNILISDAEMQAKNMASVLAENEKLRLFCQRICERIDHEVPVGACSPEDEELILEKVAGLVLENKRLDQDRTAVLSKLTATQQHLADLQTSEVLQSKNVIGTTSTLASSKNHATRDSAVDERYSYLLLLLSKLKIENVALRSRLTPVTTKSVLSAVAEEVRDLKKV